MRPLLLLSASTSPKANGWMTPAYKPLSNGSTERPAKLIVALRNTELVGVV